MIAPRILCVGALSVLCFSGAAFSQNRLDPAIRERNIREAQRRLKEAEGRLENTKKKVADAKQKAQETVAPYNEAKKVYEEAKGSLRQARADEGNIVLVLRKNSPVQKKIAAVQETAKEIAARREALRDKILAALIKKDSAYKKLKAEHDKIKRDLKSTLTPRPDLSKKMLEVGSKVGKIEQKALSANAEYTALLNEAKQNHAQLAEFNKELADSIANDPKRAAAAKAVQEALATHKQNLAALNKTEIARNRAAADYSKAVSAQRQAEKDVKQRRFQLSAARIH